MSEIQPQSSPQWGGTTKLVVALTFIAIAAWFLITFQSYIGPVMLILILVYTVYPVLARARRMLNMSWRLTVTLFFVVLVLIILGLLAWGGVTLFYQIQNLVLSLQNFVNNLPQFIDDLSKQVYTIGPFRFEFSQLMLPGLGDQIINSVKPVLGELGNLIGQIAGGAASVIASLVFILLISYFVLAESGGIQDSVFHWNIPGYSQDFQKLSSIVGKIWNSFLRCQILFVVIAICIYSVVLTILGVPYSLGLAIIAGLARFIPYLGTLTMYITYGLVIYFQGIAFLGVSPLVYALIVIGVIMLTDAILDNMIYTKLMSDTLSIHPAVVMVGTLIAAQLIGFIGIILAAPVMATAKLFIQYGVKKMFDQDPWEDIVISKASSQSFSFQKIVQYVKRWSTRLRKKVKKLWEAQRT